MFFFMLDIAIIIIAFIVISKILKRLINNNTNKQENLGTETKGSSRIKINPDTGYPMSTSKQIENAYQKYLEARKPSKPNKYMNSEEIWQINQLNLILPFYFKGDYCYKLGDWKEAEWQWQNIAELMPHAAIKLAIMYRKEKRYSDEINVLTKAVNSKEIERLYPNNKEQLQFRLAKAKKRYLKNNTGK